MFDFSWSSGHICIPACILEHQNGGEKATSKKEVGLSHQISNACIGDVSRQMGAQRRKGQEAAPRARHTGSL